MSTQSLPEQSTPLPPTAPAVGFGRRLWRRFRFYSWRRWLVLLIMGLVIITMEIRDHRIMHREHQSGQTLLEDAELFHEIILFGLVFPLVTGFLLNYMESVEEERDDAARALEERRAFLRQVHEATDWPQLVQLVVASPGSFVSAQRAFLMAQRAREESFSLVSSWYRQADARRESEHPILPGMCAVCSAAGPDRLVATSICHHHRAGNGSPAARRYCLRLATGEEESAALVFDVPEQQPLSEQQLQLMNDLGTEIALAISNANLAYAGGRQQEATRSERQRIARDLHDTLAQSISYLHLKLDQLSAENTLVGIVEVQREITKMRDVATDAYQQVRNTLAELRSEHQGQLDEALRAYLKSVTSRTEFAIDVHSQGQVRTLHPHVQRQVLFIIREALINVEKHARAQRGSISLDWVAERLTVTIVDDGVGFSPGVDAGGDRYGLLIMNERASALGGSVAVTSQPGSGTRVTLHVPLSGEND